MARIEFWLDSRVPVLAKYTASLHSYHTLMTHGNRRSVQESLEMSPRSPNSIQPQVMNPKLKQSSPSEAPLFIFPHESIMWHFKTFITRV